MTAICYKTDKGYKHIDNANEKMQDINEHLKQGAVCFRYSDPASLSVILKALNIAPKQ